MSGKDSRIVHPPGWGKPRGYSDAVVASGRYLVLSGQIGWNPDTMEFETDDFGAQTRQALQNIVTLLHEASASPADVVRLTWYVVDRDEYMAARREIGVSYRELFNGHYPAMTVIVVSGLLKERARVEIEATAVIPDKTELRKR